jgi:hypothetical protein
VSLWGDLRGEAGGSAGTSLHFYVARLGNKLSYHLQSQLKMTRRCASSLYDDYLPNWQKMQIGR